MQSDPFLSLINKTLAEIKYGDSPAELYDPISYIMSLGGKRMRPIATLMACQLFDPAWQKAIKPAIAVEVFHNFTLMHDDIMDGAPLRRGKPTVHEKWNRDIAILSGDVMLVAAYELMGEVPEKHLKKVLKRFNKTAAEVCEGQQLDMNFATQNNVTEADYINMIRLKTSVLLGFALELGAIIADQADEVSHSLFEIGVNLGLGFQLKDDILDVYGDPEKFGKQVGGDIIENKKTWLMLKAFELSAGKEIGHELKTWIDKKNFDPADKVAAVTAIFNELGIKELAENEMNGYFNTGFGGIDRLKCDFEKKKPLIAFGEYLLGREH